jgi:hypothetical protein
MQAASSHARQSLTALRDESHNFALPVVWSVPKRRLAPHLRATSFDRKREVQYANLLLLGEGRGRVVLTTRYFARYSHGARKLGPTRKVTIPGLENPVSFRRRLRILHSLFPHPVSLPPIPSVRCLQKNRSAPFKNICIKMQGPVYLYKS